LDLLVELATQQKGCLGARLTGGGFGGAIVALVEQDAVEDVLKNVKSVYDTQTGYSAAGYRCRAGAGALPPDHDQA
jgi:galactokinase